METNCAGPAVDQAVRRAFKLIYGHVRERYPQYQYGIGKEKFGDMLRNDPNFAAFNELYNRWLLDIHSAAANGENPSSPLNGADAQLSAITLRDPDAKPDGVPPQNTPPTDKQY